MGEILQFPSPKKKETDVLKSSENKEGTGEYLNKDRMIEIFQILSALKNADPSSFGEKTIDRKKELVAGYSDAELIGWVNNHIENDIKIHPSFFGAIVDEIRKRELDKR